MDPSELPELRAKLAAIPQAGTLHPHPAGNSSFQRWAPGQTEMKEELEQIGPYARSPLL